MTGGIVANQLEAVVSDAQVPARGQPGDLEPTVESTELGPTERRKILRQHRDLRRVLAVIVEATRDTERSEAQRSPLLVALGLRLQSMLERHAAFEEAVLSAHFCAADRFRIDALVGEHRRQRAELSLLTKISFGNMRLGRIGLAFRWLAKNILKGMDVEERQLFGARLVRRRTVDGPRRRVVTGEYASHAGPGDGSPDDISEVSGEIDIAAVSAASGRSPGGTSG
jgi:hypothetical protein